MEGELDIYVENGYENRDHYLHCLADDYGISLDIVYSLSEMLGLNEDFDGLVIAVEEAADSNDF